jgi:hypothetical protein
MDDLDKPFKVYAKGRKKYHDMAVGFNQIENMDACYKKWTQDPEFVKQFSTVFTVVRPLPIGDNFVCPRCHKPVDKGATFCKCGQKIEWGRE